MHMPCMKTISKQKLFFALFFFFLNSLDILRFYNKVDNPPIYFSWTDSDNTVDNPLIYFVWTDSDGIVDNPHIFHLDRL